VVDPSLLFNNSKKILDGLVSVSSSCSDFRELKTFSAESLVEGLFNEDVSGGGDDGGEEGEHDGDEAGWEERRPVLGGGVDPSHQEVVVTIGESFALEVEFNSSSFVELSSGFSTEGQVSDVEVSILGEFHPLGVLSLLDAVGGPVPSVLTFDDVEFSFNFKSHD
jgi:hypothetical protein